MFKDFKKFILRGNLIDLSIGFTVGAAFSTVAKSLVTDVIMPPISLLLGQADFSNLYWLLRQGRETVGPYTTLAEAEAAGAITLNYGRFTTNILSLLLVSFAMFAVIKAINYLEDHLEDITGEKSEKDKPPSLKKCFFCIQTIPYKATRCPNCTSKLEVKG